MLRRFVEQGAIGLVTTHDLAMTRVVDELAPRAVNVHFDDWFAEGELRFDYLVKPGPVTHSNAIALMRAVGLDVEDSGEPVGMDLFLHSESAAGRSEQSARQQSAIAYFFFGLLHASGSCHKAPARPDDVVARRQVQVGQSFCW